MSTLDTRDGAPVGFSEKLASRPRRFVTRAASEPSRTARLSRTVVYILYGGCDNDIWGPLSTRSHVLRLESGERGIWGDVRDYCTRFHLATAYAGPSARDKTDEN